MDRGGRRRVRGWVQRHEPAAAGSEEDGLGEEVPDPQDPRDATYEERIIAAYERGYQAAKLEQPAPAVPQVSEAEKFYRLFEFFYRLGPPKFDGTGGYEAAEEWLANTKAKLRTSRAPEADQVELATHFLESSARFWWEGMKGEYQGDPLRITWEWFEEQFMSMYLCTVQKEALRWQFMTLRQYDQAVAEYNNLFIKLSRYAPDIREEPYRYRRHYLDGLDPEIAMVVDNPVVQKMQVLMNHAKQVEAHLKRKVQQERSRSVRPKLSKLANETKPTGKAATSACFNCGSEGHWKRDCPKLQQETTWSREPRGAGGVGDQGRDGPALCGARTGGHAGNVAPVLQEFEG